MYQCTEMVHVLGDGDDLLLGVRLGDGREFSAVVYVDHNVGTIVKDAFFADRSIDELIVLGRETAEPDTSGTRSIPPTLAAGSSSASLGRPSLSRRSRARRGPRADRSSHGWRASFPRAGRHTSCPNGATTSVTR